MDPVLPRLRKLLAGLDVDGDGVASRKDLLLAFRRDRQLADHLRMQPRVKVGQVVGTVFNTAGAGGCSAVHCCQAMVRYARQSPPCVEKSLSPFVGCCCVDLSSMLQGPRALMTQKPLHLWLLM